MGVIEDICDNAKARLIARTDVSSLWSGANTVVTAFDYPMWPLSEYACRFMLGPETKVDGLLIRGTLRADIGVFSTLDEARDQSALTGMVLEAAGKVHVALLHSFLNGSLDECLTFAGGSSARRITQEQGGGDGWGMGKYIEYTWGVATPAAFIPKGDDGTGVDRGSAS